MKLYMIDLSKIKGFEWDVGNQLKSVIKHRVSNTEAEEIFLNRPLLLSPDTAHSRQETRYFALGQTNNHRLLFVAFTIRKDKIRIISSRNMNKKEKSKYEKA